MKTRVLISLVLIALASVYAQAQQLQVTVDELGNGVFGTQPMPGVITGDPSQPGRSALVYTLPQPLVGVSGDVILTEAGGGISDIIRFWKPAAGGPSQLIFYSDNADGTDQLADNSGLPAQLPNTTTLLEGILYTPGKSTDPGLLESPVTYNFNSDVEGVPEGGATVLLLSLSLFGLWGAKRTFHRTK